MTYLMTHIMTHNYLDFFTKHPIKAAERSIKQGLEKIETTAALAERDGEAIKNFFK